MNVRHRDIFNSVLGSRDFKFTNKQISAWCGYDQSKLSRFLSGKRDLKTAEFFHLLESMPEEFQKRFWHRFHSSQEYPNLQSIIADMDRITLSRLVSLIGEELFRKMSESDGHARIEEELSRIKLWTSPP